MKKTQIALVPLITLILLNFFTGSLKAQNSGIFEGFVITTTNGGSNTYNQLIASGGFNGAFLGDFDPSSSFVLKGGQAKTFKNGTHNVFNAQLFYRVYSSGSPSGNFSSVNLNFAQNLSNPGDQLWDNVIAGSPVSVDLLDGLSTGNYTLEVYLLSEVDTNFDNQVDTTNFLSNNSSNYKANFNYYADNDGDGFNVSNDCDDTDSAVNPGASEIYFNSVDDDCNPATPDINSGLFESFVIVNNTFYDLDSATGNIDFEGVDFGTFDCNSSLNLDGGENKIFKCAFGDGNILDGSTFYRVYLQGEVPPAFNEINLDFASDDGVSDINSSCLNQTWQTNGASINILDNVTTSGMYTIEVYNSATYSYETGSGTHLANNSGENYKASFTYINNAPTAIAKDLTVFLDANGLASVTPEDVDDGSFDDCGPVTLELSQVQFSCADLGANNGPSTPVVWINEIHYDNAGADSNEFIEIAGTSGIDLSGYSILLYNGTNGTVYDTILLSGVLSDQSNNFGFYVAEVSGIQNGSPDGIALINDQAEVVEFLSYEGSFTATGGPAAGMTSVDLGVSETSTTPVGFSLQRVGSGNDLGDFIWSAPLEDTPNAPNTNQNFEDSSPSGSGVEVVLTVTDLFGNVAVASSIITVIDNTSPVINCPADITVESELDNCGASVNFDLSAIDNCSGNGALNVAPEDALIITGVIDGPLSGGTPKAVELYAVTDIADLSVYGLGSANNGGGSDGQEYTFNAVSVVAGEFIYIASESISFNAFFGFTPNATTSAVAINGDDALELFYNGSVVDTFGDINTAGSGQSWEYTDGWAYRILDTGPDASTFNSNNWSFSGPNALDNESSNGTAVNPFPLGMYTQSLGSSSNISLSASIDSGSFFSVGETEVEVTATDASGNASTCTFTVTVVDTQAPTINCLTDITTETDPNQCGAVVTYNTPQGIDNCDGAATEQIEGIASGELFPVGTTTNVFRVTDAAGLITECSFDVTVEDIEAPVVQCPADISVGNEEDSCFAVVMYDLIVSDNCEGYTVTQTSGLESGSAFPIGVTSNSFTVTDASGNSTECSFTVTVNDTQEPVIDCPSDVVVTNDPGQCGAEVEFSFGATDNCLDENVNVTPDQALIISGVIDGPLTGGTPKAIELYALVDIPDLSSYGIGTAFNGGASDGVDLGLTGAVSQGQYIYIASEAIGFNDFFGFTPDFVSTAMSINGDDVIELFYNGQVTDAFGVLGTDGTNESWEYLDGWAYRIENTAMDNANFMASEWSFSTPNALDGAVSNATANTAFPIGTYTQSVSITPAVTVSSSIDSGSFFGLGDTEVQITATDASGNTSTCSFIVTVNDNEVPVITTNGDMSVEADLDFCGAHVNVLASVTDNCEVVVPIGTRSDGLPLSDPFPVGTTLVTWNAADASGNNAIAVSQTVTVEDLIIPEVLCQNITVNLDSNGMAAITASDVDGGSTDNCGIATMEVYPNTFTCDNIGDNTVLLTVKDSSGNAEFCEATVTVLGDLPSVEIIANNSENTCEAGVILTAVGEPGWTYLWNTGATTQDILVDANGMYTVTATSTTNCSASVSYNLDDYSADNFIASYTILAEDKVVLTNNDVLSGGVGATSSTGEISLKRGSNVNEFVKAESVYVSSSSAAGNTISSPALVQIPAFQANTQSSSSSPDVLVNFFQTKVLSGTVYDKIEVRYGGKVVFTQPNVYIREFVTFKNTTVEFQQCTNLYVQNRFRLGLKTKFNAAGHPVSVFVDSDVRIFPSAKVTANIHANDHTISVFGTTWFNAPPTEMRGQFIAKTVLGLHNVVWTQSDQCSSCVPTSSARGIQDISLKTPLEEALIDLKVYPNPSNGDFNLSLVTKELDTEAKVSVYNMQGRLVYAATLDPRLSLTFGGVFDSGVYIVKVSQGEQTKTIKLTRF